MCPVGSPLRLHSASAFYAPSGVPLVTAERRVRRAAHHAPWERGHYHSYMIILVCKRVVWLAHVRGMRLIAPASVGKCWHAPSHRRVLKCRAAPRADLMSLFNVARHCVDQFCLTNILFSAICFVSQCMNGGIQNHNEK